MAQVVDNPARNRFEMQVEGATAFVDYRVTDGVLVVPHTEVPRALDSRSVVNWIGPIAAALGGLRPAPPRCGDMPEKAAAMRAPRGHC